MFCKNINLDIVAFSVLPLIYETVILDKTIDI